MSLEFMEQKCAEAETYIVILETEAKTLGSNLYKINRFPERWKPKDIMASYAEVKLPDLLNYISQTCKPAIAQFIGRVDQLSDRETTLLKKMLNHQYRLATLPIKNLYNGTDVFDGLQLDSSYGTICLYEEFNKIASLIHNLFTANMMDEMKGTLNYLITSSNNLPLPSGYLSFTPHLNINPNCYGLFGPALKSEEAIRITWDTESQTWKDTCIVTFSKKTLTHAEYIVEDKFAHAIKAMLQKAPKAPTHYRIGYGDAIATSSTHQKFFSLEEVLAYRKSIHVFFGDLMKLCNIDETAFETLVLPVLKLLVRGEAEITVEFVNTLMEFVPKDAMEAAMKVAKKFAPTPKSQKAAAAAASEAPGDEDEELAAALLEHHAHTSRGIRPYALINACGVENPDDSVLNLMSGGNFAKTVRTFKDPTTGNTLAHFAAQDGNVQSIRTLDKYAANMDAINNDGKKPIDLVPEGKDDVLQAFAEAGGGRMTPISGEVVEAMSKLAANLGEDPDFEAFFADIKTLHQFADAKYTGRAAQVGINAALESADPDAMMQFFTNLGYNTSMPALDAPYDDVMVVGSLFD